MYYYLVETPTGTKTVKRSEPIYNKDHARLIVQGPICFYSKVSPVVYYFNKIFRKA